MHTLAFTPWPDVKRLLLRLPLPGLRIDFHPAGRALRLEAGQHLVLHDAAGSLVKVTAGAAWITQEGDIKDNFVASGECFLVERPGETLVAPTSRATLRVLPPGEAGKEMARLRLVCAKVLR